MEKIWLVDKNYSGIGIKLSNIRLFGGDSRFGIGFIISRSKMGTMTLGWNESKKKYDVVEKTHYNFELNLFLWAFKIWYVSHKPTKE